MRVALRLRRWRQWLGAPTKVRRARGVRWNVRPLRASVPIATVLPRCRSALRAVSFLSGHAPRHRHLLPFRIVTDERENGERETRERELAGLLDYLHRSRGLDLSGYKRVGLLRRLTKRMRAVNVGGFGEYVEYLDTHPNEYTSLLDTLLINVTAFFRDDLPWEYLSSDIIPTLLAQKSPTEAIRVWCAGCASGEEAYTLAIVLAEALGLEAFRERVKIYATDVDEEALTKARHALYEPKELEGVPPGLLEKYFEPANHRRVFHKELRRSVIFGRHDLIQDAPISR